MSDQPNHTELREQQVRDGLARASASFLAELALIARWRERQEAGDEAPVWGQWWEGRIVRGEQAFDVLYMPLAYHGSDIFEVRGPINRIGYHAEIREGRRGLTPASAAQEIIHELLDGPTRKRKPKQKT